MSLGGKPGNDDPGHLMGWRKWDLHYIWSIGLFLFTIVRKGGEQRDKRERERKGRKGGRDEGRLVGRKCHKIS